MQTENSKNENPFANFVSLNLGILICKTLPIFEKTLARMI